MRKIIAKVVYCLLWFKIRKESQRTDSVLCIYGHNQKQHPFEELVKWLLRNDYHFITPQDLYLFLQESKRLNRRIRIVPDKEANRDKLDGWSYYLTLE